jgi:hypothetical protein
MDVRKDLIADAIADLFGSVTIVERNDAALVDARRSARKLRRFEQASDHPVLPTLPETEYFKGFLLEMVPGREGGGARIRRRRKDESAKQLYLVCAADVPHRRKPLPVENVARAKCVSLCA